MNVDPRLALLVIVVVVATILLLGNARPLGTAGPVRCGDRNPAGQARGCPPASEAD